MEYQIEQFKLPAEFLTKEIQKILAESVFDLSTMSSLSNKVQNVKNIFNSIMESLYLAGIPGMYESIVEGANTKLEDCEKIEWK